MNIQQRIRDSIRPQLNEALDLQKGYERQAYLERIRRQWGLWHATEAYIEREITRRSLQTAGESVGRTWRTIRDAFAAAAQAVIDEVTPIYDAVAAGYAAQNGQNRAPAAPVPATDTIPHQDQ